MSEKYFVVSESELKHLRSAAAYQGYGAASEKETEKAEAVCRARPVRFIGAADQGNSLMLWGEVKK
jgi:hypothetical protein